MVWSKMEELSAGKNMIWRETLIPAVFFPILPFGNRSRLYFLWFSGYDFWYSERIRVLSTLGLKSVRIRFKTKYKYIHKYTNKTIAPLQTIPFYPRFFISPIAYSSFQKILCRSIFFWYRVKNLHHLLLCISTDLYHQLQH